MIKKIVLSIGFFLFLFSIQAQILLSFSPEKPKPGEMVRFSYTPPITAFDAADRIECVVYKWGVYEDEYSIATGNKPRPIDLVLKKNGNSYEGEVQTDALTRMLSFLFTSGDVKWKKVDRKSVLTNGKVDNNSNTGYSVLFYDDNGKVCQYSNYFRGEYLFLESMNKTGFSNPEKATACFLKELESWPDSKYYGYQWLGYAMENDRDALKTLVSKEMEKLFATGLKTEQDWNLMVSLSSAIKLKEQAKYFYNETREKFKNSGGSASHASFFDKYGAEKDLAKKEEIMNQANKVFNGLSYNDKSKLAYSSGIPMYFKSYYLQELANNGRLDDYKSKLNEFNLSPENNPYNYNSFKRALDTLLIKDNCKEYAKKMAQDYYAFYSQRVSQLIAVNQLSPSEYDGYYSIAERKEMAFTGAAQFADMCSQVCYKAGDYKKGLQYAKEAQKYMQLLSQPLYDAADYNNRYCILAEKVLPVKACKAEIEKMVASGAWKTDMIDILKRFYVKEKKTETGFDGYIANLKKSQNELLKESLKAEMLNEPAPGFSLTDIDGKTVNLSDLKGKTVILDFWATWCGPCKASFPAMKKLIGANKNDPDVKILFVNTFERFKDEKENQDKVVEFIKANNYPFQVIYDFKNKVSADYKVTGIPTKCIVDKNGNLRYRIVGAEVNESKLIDEINAMIETIK